MRHASTLDIGLDGHQESIAVADVAPAHEAEVIYLGTSGTRHADLDHLVRQLHANATHLVVVQEAGPCGYWRSRDLATKGPRCWVVAPSLMPTKAGDRGNTDRRDAVQLARLRRSGDLTPVDVPQVEDEALRDLTRARAEALSALKAATLRLNAFLLRHAIRSTGRAAWGPAPLRWLSAGLCATPAQQLVCQAYGRAVHEHPARLQRLEHELHEPVKPWRLQPVVEARQALRGVQCTVAVPLVAELGDLTRVDNPRPLRN